MASGIQQGIASKYYAMADRAQTPDQINQVRQLLAKTIQSGGLPAYEGIPIVEQLNGKYQTALQQATMAGQTKAGLIPPSSQPMAQEILAQAQQPEEEEVDSGIDELASNLPTEEYAEGGIVGFAVGGGVSDAYREAYDRIFGKRDSGASGASTSTSKGGITIPSMTGAGRPSVPIIGAPPAMIGGIPSIETLGPKPTANQQGIGSLISNFDPNKGTNRVTLPKGALAAGEYTNTMGSGPDASYLMELLQDQKLNPNDATIQKEIDKIVNKKQINPLTQKEIPIGQQTLEYVQSQIDAGKKPPVAATRRPDALPDNVQAVLDQYKTSKKVSDTLISNKPNAPAKGPAAPAAPAAPREEMGPPRDLMAAEAPVVDTTPKEDAISKYEKMLTQAPEQRKKERDLDFYTRLFQAGIGVASGSSRNALENLKEAQPAIAGFASDIAKQREEDRNRIKDLASLGLKREEFALEVKKLGISEKQANAIAKHYDDYFKLGQEKNRITEQHYKDVAKNYANAAGNLGARLESTQGIAQDRNIAGLIKSYAAMPSNYGKSPAELRAMALQALGLSGGAGGAGGPTTLSYADFAKGLK